MIWMSVSTPCDSNIIVNCFRHPCIYPLLHHVIACLLTSFSCPATQATPHLLLCCSCLPGSENETKWRSSISAQLSYPTLLFSRVAHHPRETHFIQVSPTQIERENSHIYLYLCFIQHNIYEPWNTMDPRVSSFWLGWHWKQFPRFWIMFSPSR